MLHSALNVLRYIDRCLAYLSLLFEALHESLPAINARGCNAIDLRRLGTSEWNAMSKGQQLGGDHPIYLKDASAGFGLVSCEARL